MQIIPHHDIPPAPALPPEEGLKSFRIDEDFEISLAAHEPHVQTPFAAAFDGDGRKDAVKSNVLSQLRKELSDRKTIYTSAELENPYT